MNKHQQQNVNDVATLFPYLNFGERLIWIEHLRHLFDDDFSATAAALMRDMR